MDELADLLQAGVGWVVGYSATLIHRVVHVFMHMGWAASSVDELAALPRVGCVDCGSGHEVMRRWCLQ